MKWYSDNDCAGINNTVIKYSDEVIVIMIVLVYIVYCIWPPPGGPREAISLSANYL